MRGPREPAPEEPATGVPGGCFGVVVPHGYGEVRGGGLRRHAQLEAIGLGAASASMSSTSDALSTVTRAAGRCSGYCSGVHVVAGVVYYDAAESAGSGALEGALVVPVAGAPDRIEPGASLDGAARLADLAERARQDLRDVSPDRVAMVATRQHADVQAGVPPSAARPPAPSQLEAAPSRTRDAGCAPGSSPPAQVSRRVCRGTARVRVGRW